MKHLQRSTSQLGSLFGILRHGPLHLRTQGLDLLILVCHCLTQRFDPSGKIVLHAHVVIDVDGAVGFESLDEELAVAVVPFDPELLLDGPREIEFGRAEFFVEERCLALVCSGCGSFGAQFFAEVTEFGTQGSFLDGGIGGIEELLFRLALGFE